MNSLLPTLPLFAVLGSVASGQGLVPALVSDTSGDTIWLCTDLDQNGDYNGVGELTIFYDDQSGNVTLTNNAGMVRGADGTVFVSDASEDIVLRLRDLDQNGDALGALEANVFFDASAGNGTGIEFTSARQMWLDDDGTVWVANANTGGGGEDMVVWLRDQNGDGDAQDAGEHGIYYLVPGGGSVGDSIPTAVARGLDGAIYYTETGSTGFYTKGVYRLEDLDGSGSIDQPGEATLFFEPSPQGGTPFHWNLDRDAQGRFYLGDSGNDVLWRFADTNGNGTIDVGTEDEQIYAAPGSSLIWSVGLALDGSLYVAEDQSPDRILRLVDLDNDDLFLSAGEETTVYDETFAAANIGSPKVIVLIQGEATVGVSECSPAVANSTGAPGTIVAVGSSSIAANDVLLRAESLPPSQFGIFVVSRNAAVTAVSGSQGILCLGGSIGRYNTILNSGAAGTFELPIDLTQIPQGLGSVAAAAGDTWRFQAWSRDNNPQPTSNFTDAVAVTFVP